MCLYFYLFYVFNVYLFVFTAVLWELLLNFCICVILLASLYYEIASVNSKLYNIYHNINSFLLSILSYYTYNGTEYSDVNI